MLPSIYKFGPWRVPTRPSPRLDSVHAFINLEKGRQLSPSVERRIVPRSGLNEPPRVCDE